MMISLRCIWFETVATDFETAAVEARDRRSLNDHFFTFDFISENAMQRSREYAAV